MQMQNIIIIIINIIIIIIFIIIIIIIIIIVIIIIVMSVVYFIPVRYIVLVWGIKKFTDALNTGRVKNDEILNILSRIPTLPELRRYEQRIVTDKTKMH